MDQKLKAGVYNKVMRALKQNPNIDGLSKDEDEIFGIYGTICNGIEFRFVIRKEQEFFIIRATTPPIKLTGDATITELASEITEDTDINFNSYEEVEPDEDGNRGQHLVFQLLVPFVGTEGVEAQKLVFNKTLAFVQIMCRNKDRLGCENAASNMEALDFTKEAEDDPFGFDSFSDADMDDDELVTVTQGEEDPYTPSPESERKESERDGFPEPEAGIFTAPADLFAPGPEDDHDMNKNNLIEADSDYGDVESADKYGTDDIDRILAEMNERKTAREERARKRREKEPIQPVHEPSSGDDIFDDHEDADAGEPDIEMLSNVFDEDDYENGIPSASPAGDKEAPCDISDIMGEFLVGDEKQLVSDAGGACIGDEHISETEKEGIELSKTETELKPIGYQRAPEVVEQMKHLYAEMDGLFAKRKEMADDREKTLDAYSERLEKRNGELDIREKRLADNYAELQQDLKTKLLDVETQKHELEFQWSKLDAEKKMLETATADLKEKQRIFDETSRMDKEAADSEDHISFIQTEMEDKNRELESIRGAFATVKTEYEEQVKMLQEQIESMRGSENAADYEKKIADAERTIAALKEDIGDLTKDVEDLTSETDQKSEVIKALNNKQKMAEKEKESWARKEDAYRLQIKNLTVAQEYNATDERLQDDLDAANLKIGELEAELKKVRNSPSKDDAETVRLKQELAQAKEDLRKADEAYEKEKASRVSPSDSDKQTIAVKIKESLSEIGIAVDPVATATNEVILSGSFDLVNVVVNVDAGVIYADKAVKRGIKYRPQIERWNEEDIRTSYMFSDKKIICKCTYDDVAKSALDIIGRFADLK